MINWLILFNELAAQIRYIVFGYFRYGLVLNQQGEVVPWYGTTFQSVVHDDLLIGEPVEWIYSGPGSYEMILPPSFDRSKYKVILHSMVPGVSISDGENGGYLIQTSNGSELANGMLSYTYLEIRLYKIG